MRPFLLSITLALVACGTLTEKPDAAPPDDAREPDAPDAMVAPPPSPPGRELAVAAGRLSGGAWTVEVHVGSLSDQSTTTGGSWSVRGGTPINP